MDKQQITGLDRAQLLRNQRNHQRVRPTWDVMEIHLTLSQQSGLSRREQGTHELVCAAADQARRPGLGLRLQGRNQSTTTFHQLFKQTICNRYSDAVYSLTCDALRGTVFVEYKQGGHYLYSNVSRRAIANLMLNPNMSLGFWVNKNCKIARVRFTGYTKGHAYSCG